MDSVLTNIKQALSDLMNINTREMGDALRISDVYAAIDNIEGVIYVELENPDKTITAASNELLILGEINLSLQYQQAGEISKNV